MWLELVQRGGEAVLGMDGCEAEGVRTRAYGQTFVFEDFQVAHDLGYGEE